MKLPFHILRLVVASVAALASATATAASVDYLREVKPILAEHCYRCHGASQQKGGLRLDTAAMALKGGSSGPSFSPGKSAESLLVQAIKGTHPEISRMPYKKPPLSDAHIALIQKWIDAGGQAPADEAPESNLHWSFVAPKRLPLPAVQRRDWPRNPIDFFILARLEKEGIEPSPEADRYTLIRRLNLDLIGLPPTLAEVEAFVNDQRPDAYERLVERLLSSPHYGERWARHWLDVARYGDSNGYSIDAPRSIWKYRDWVIHAFNRDLPFDEFVIDQIAGDLRPNATVEQKIATGFHRNTQINQEGGIDPEQFRVESVIDRVNTTATAFLGLTVACAQCHDHKFDPITQREYYQLYAFFNNTVEDGHGKGAPEGVLEIPGETSAADELQKELEEAEAELDRFLNTKGSEIAQWDQSLTSDEREKLKPEVRDALKRPFAEWNIKQKRAVYAAYKPNDSEFKQRETKVARLERRQPKPVTTLVMVERQGVPPRPSHVMIKGDFTRPGEPVTPGVPAILHPLEVERTAAKAPGDAAPVTAGSEADADSENASSGPGQSAPALLNRLDLARWLVDPANPLTARVIVNRIWQQYFGRGIVETENDFGTQGIPPTHPELLDWLARELMEPTAHASAAAHSAAVPWSLKHIHRLIVMSATYRQSSRARPDLDLVDPNNRLLARQARLRLDAELVRDVALTASGLLAPKIGGPSVFPPQPNGVMTLGQVKRDWKPSTGPDRYRRGLYTFFWRATPHPALMVFDSPDGFSTCTRRVRSNTPLQALTLLNDEAFYEFAQALGRRIVTEGPPDDAERMEFAFRLCLSRSPSPSEKERLQQLLGKELVAFQQSPDEALAVVGGKSEIDQAQLAAWTVIARVLLNLDETITRE